MQSKVCRRKGNSLLCHLWLFKTILLNKKSCSMTSPSAGKREYYVVGMRKMEALCDGKSSAVCSSHFVRKCTMLVYEFEKKKSISHLCQDREREKNLFCNERMNKRQQNSRSQLNITHKEKESKPNRHQESIQIQ